jgi:hypothetical protein
VKGSGVPVLNKRHKVSKGNGDQMMPPSVKEKLQFKLKQHRQAKR